MISPDRLVHGKCYFLLMFAHPRIEIPVIKTLIYIGKNVYPPETPSEDEYYFQDPESYLEHGSFLNLSKETEYKTLLVTKDSLFTMYDLKGLIGTLSEIKSC